MIPTPTVVTLKFGEREHDPRIGSDFAREFASRLDVGREQRLDPEEYWTMPEEVTWVLPDVPERVPEYVALLDEMDDVVEVMDEEPLRSFFGKPLTEDERMKRSRELRRNPETEATMVTPFEPPSPYRVVVLTMHQSGPKQTIIECDYMEQAVEVAERERGRQTNRRDNAIVRVDAAKGPKYKPRVQWTFRGEWKREMQ
jgi:hypothetical protein